MRLTRPLPTWCAATALEWQRPARLTLLFQAATGAHQLLNGITRKVATNNINLIMGPARPGATRAAPILIMSISKCVCNQLALALFACRARETAGPRGGPLCGSASE
jgi:hypothetical protein